MKKLATIALAAGAVLAVTATTASAQPWTSINQRQAQLQQRIDQGVRHGDLTRNEAYKLQRQMSQLAHLEARYRRNGLSSWERADLDQRFDRLSAQVRFERHDRQQYGYGYHH